MLLWVLNDDGKHTLRDLFVAYWHLHPGLGWKAIPIHCYREHPKRHPESRVGIKMDRLRQHVRRTPCCLRMRRGHLFLRQLLCHLLAQEERNDAGPHILKWTDKQRRGHAHRLRLPDLQAPKQQNFKRVDLGNSNACCQNWNGLRARIIASGADWHEFCSDGSIHQICGWQIALFLRCAQVLSRRKSFRVDGDDITLGKDKLLRKACRRILESRSEERNRWRY